MAYYIHTLASSYIPVRLNITITACYQLRLSSKGEKFVLAPKKIVQVKKFDDFMAFARNLRLTIYFYEKAKRIRGER